MKHRLPASELLWKPVYGGQDWVIIPELRPGRTCNLGKKRQIDFFAIDLKDPDRNRIAFECKSSMSDFQNEIRDPNKRAPFMDLAQRFYIILLTSYLRDYHVRQAIHDLPDGCGLIGIGGGQTTELVPAPYRHVSPIPPESFLASLRNRATHLSQRDTPLPGIVDPLVSTWEKQSAVSWPRDQLISSAEDAFQAAGWETKIGAHGRGWRADLLALNGQEKLALEFNLDDPRRRFIEWRDVAYRREGVQPLWIVSHEPLEGNLSLKLPYLTLLGDPSEPEVEIDGERLPLKDLFAEMAAGKTRWGLASVDESRSGVVATYPVECRSCREPFTALTPLRRAQCHCGRKLSDLYYMLPDVFDESVRPLIEAGEIEIGELPLAILSARKFRYTDDPEIINRCPSCRAAHDHEDLDSDFMRASRGEIGQAQFVTVQAKHLLGSLELNGEHLCRAMPPLEHLSAQAV